jgi:pectate lyase
MRALWTFVIAVLMIGAASVGAPGVAAQDGTNTPAAGPPFAPSVARQSLPAGDGWAALGAGTTGGASAAADHIAVVSNRQQLLAALGSGGAARIVLVRGTIDVGVDDSGQPLTCASYAAPDYSLEAYLQAYDPATWGKVKPSGALENARAASQRNQGARIKIKVSSNTTLIGLGPDAQIVGANLIIDQVDNVIVRNITFESPVDCFPQWDPTDGSAGNWNSQYDSISLTAATHVWVNHCAFTDGRFPDSQNPTYFGRPYQVHDGELDITKGSDLVTASWNHFREHDKTMLIGSTDSPTYDVGKLRVTLHHNLFDGIIQRAPRVRFGQVHLYNNLYEIDPAEYEYSIGVGYQSQTVAQNNYFETAEGFAPDRLLRAFKGTAVQISGSLVGGHGASGAVDLLAAYNAVNDPDLSGDVGWTPTLFTQMHPTDAVPALVRREAGPFSAPLFVAQDNSGEFTTVQAAVDAIPDGNSSRAVIVVRPGTYREVLNVPSSKPYILLMGATGNPRDVVITYDNASGTPKPDGSTYGTSGSATVTISGHDFEARNLTFENSFDEKGHPEIKSQQAVAVKTQADRLVFDNVRFIGNQDTLYVNSPAVGAAARHYFRGCYIEGDVDFIFGRGTAVFDRCVIRALSRGSATNNGYVTAASTPDTQKYGFLITRSTILSDAPDQSFYLGRPWHPGGDPTALGQVLIRDSWLAAAVKTAPWTDMSGFSWREARFAEYNNSGPGAAPGPDRPLLTPAQAAEHTVQSYLAGADSWNPVTRR